MTDGRSVVVFDGVCVLCNRWVDFILRHDHAGQFQLAAMQGRHGRALLAAHGLSPDDPASFLLVRDGHAYTDSDAILRLLQQLGSGWRFIAGCACIIPRICRDPLYRWIARHRYRLFGKRAQCRVPDPAQAWRFLD